jgi:membrane protein implicated in regulation of membrane protease activity
MAGRRQESARIVEKRIEAATRRSQVRWDAAKRIVPAAFACLAAFGVSTQIAGEATTVNVGLAAAVSVTLPAGLAKMWWDRTQKRRLRERITELEDENRSLIGEVGELRGQLRESRRQRGELR